MKPIKPMHLTSTPVAPVASTPAARPVPAPEPPAKPWALEEMQESAAAMLAKMRKFPMDLRD